jgi:hypothetical protein
VAAGAGVAQDVVRLANGRSAQAAGSEDAALLR